MIAYFIGGSWDLTKRTMTHCPPVWEIIITPRLPKAAMSMRPDDMELVSNIKCERELYVRARHDHETEVAIYIYEDWYP